jgi:sialic acid synthase SpsE
VNSQGKIQIIAEIGSNHDGKLDKALELIDIAAECGADIAKFQSFLADEMVASSHENHGLLKRLEMPLEWYPKLMERCARRGIRFLSTATNFRTLDWMEEYGAWGYKVASCNITYTSLIDRLVEIGKPLIISTGMATFDEIFELANELKQRGQKSATFLHCIAKYPCPGHEMRLRNITVLQDVLPYPVGLSDHSKGVHMPAASVAMGVRMIEKHLTDNPDGFSPDHAVSITPEEFATMVSAVREIEQALVADFTPDRDTIHSMRRSLHFARDMIAGEEITRDCLLVTRPEDGILPRHLPSLLGRRLVRDVGGDDPLTWDKLA